MYDTLIKISKMKSFYVKYGIHLLDSLPSEAGQFMCNVLKGWSPSHPTIQVWSLNSNWGRLLMVWGSVLCRWRESCSHLNNDLVRNKRLFPGEQPSQLVALSWLQMESPRTAPLPGGRPWRLQPECTLVLAMLSQAHPLWGMLSALVNQPWCLHCDHLKRAVCRTFSHLIFHLSF